MTREQEIKKYMDFLKISKEEAEELYKADHEDIITPEMAEMERKAKQIKRYEKSDKTRKSSPRERKVDIDKAHILDLLIKGFTSEHPRMVQIKNETEFSFNYNENAYTVKLVKHRPKK